jgi:general secretion pathway protein J
VRACGPAGFTLLEVLVAVLVFGILMTSLVQGTQFGLRAWTLQAHIVEAHQDLDVVDRTLRRLVSTMDPGNRAYGPPNFSGNRRSMAFTGALPDAVDAFGTRQADVILSVDTAHRLVLRWAAHFAAPLGPPLAPHVTELLTDVDHLELSYWTAGQSQDHWADEWSSDVLPRLVRIKIVFGPGDTRQWPPILASVDTQP